MSSEKKITLKSSDGKTFEVEETAALESQTIKHMVEDDCANDEIPLPNVTSTILSKVIEYCKKHAEARSGESTEDDLRTWDADFVKVDQDTLFDLILAANYLEIKSLLDLTCQTVADMIKGKTPEELRKIFNLEEPSPEEEEEIRKENPWAFDTIILKSSDGTRFKVGYEVALMSQTIKRMVVDDEDKTVVVLQLNVTSTILAKVIEYCKKHVETRSTEDDLRNWDADFIKVDRGTLYDLMTAANYLNIKSLQHLTFLTYVGVSQRKD